MQVIKWQIEEASRELKSLKDKERVSFISVKQKWDCSYNDLTNRSEMIFCLMQGEKYNPYSLMVTFIDRVDYCDIRKDNDPYGYPSGFIAPEAGLFNATMSFHKKMWIHAVKNGETCSFSEYVEKLRDNAFLIDSFNNHVKEKGTGVYSTRPYLIEYEEKRIKSGKWYVWIENTTRRL